MARAQKKEPVAQSVTALITQDEAINSFKAHATGYLRQSITLACSAAVVLIVGTNAPGDGKTQDDVLVTLKESVKDTGLSDSQVAKYIGLARSLVNHLLRKFKVGGPVNEVLQAFTPDEAVNALVNYLGAQHVANLEGLTIMFEKYRRKGNKVGKAAGRAALPPVIDTGIVTGPATSGETVLTHRRVDTGQNVTVQPKLSDIMDATVLTAQQIIDGALKSGHTVVDLADAVLDRAASADLDFIRQKLLSRSRDLSKNGSGKQPAVPVAA